MYNVHLTQWKYCRIISPPQSSFTAAAPETQNTHTDLLVEELLQDNVEDSYVNDSDNDLMKRQREEMDKDEELSSIMASVFGPEADEECP